MCRTNKSAFAILLVLAMIQPAKAFNELGHSVVGKLAYDQLTAPQRAALGEILAAHPHYGEYLAANKPLSAAAEEWALVRAGAWSDWIRGNHTAEYHKSPWHYINYPYRRGMAVGTSLPMQLPQDQNILERLPRVIIAASPSEANELDLSGSLSAAQRRAVALCWLCHLMGDLHQPLHVVALIDDERFPASSSGDRGGNELAVVVSGTRPTRLHSYWDSALGYDASYANIVELARSLSDDPPLSPAELEEQLNRKNLDEWALESYQLAVKYAYLSGDLPIARWKPEYSGPDAVAGPEVPVLSESTKADVRKICRQRIYLAGHRLARQLTSIVP